MRLAVERHHVMLALRGELDVAHQHEIVVAGGLAKGAVEHLGRALVVALIELVEGLDHAARRIQQALAARCSRRYRRAASAPPLRPRRATGAAGRRERRPPEIGRIEFAPGGRLGSFAVGGLVSECGRMDLINASMSSPFDRSLNGPECHRQTGRLCRRTPEIPQIRQTAADHRADAGLYFRHCHPYIGLLDRGRQGRSRPAARRTSMPC